ncbi:MAG: hypothetical protein N4A33_09720 [Bacteriovoracaceae bacterium]|jgi:shikimate dehydrogenase|nr:hypothetical protein [Bacteriovoracaceae bacterium]
MLKLGLLGKNITHSKSKEIYQRILKHKFTYSYFDIADEKQIDLNSIFDDVSFLSVTSPYKKYCSKKVCVEEQIKDLNAINCIKKVENKLFGTNTDYEASVEIIQKYASQNIINVIVLGDGAMATVISKILLDMRINFEVLSRKKSNLSTIADYINHKVLIINCCGREFNLYESLKGLSPYKIWDLNYSQIYEKQISDEFGKDYTNGLELLFLQAKKALSYWNIL